MNTPTDKPTLSAVLIVKNEAKHLAACLDTVKDWVDEIIILDSGSTDETETIARRYTDKFYVNTQWPGFGQQRQLAQQYVNSDYVLWLDADERVTPQLKQSIQNVLQTNQRNVVYSVNRLSTAFGKFIRHSGWHPDWIVRLYRPQDTHYNDVQVHESVIVPPNYNIVKIDGNLEHYTFDDFFEFQKKQSQYAELWAQEKHSKGKKTSISSAIGHALFSFIRSYFIKCGFLDGKHGFIIACINMQYVLNKYLGLYLKQNK
ncbi:glycosyltransferase family 2 protein [Photobacterium kishitanii]|uniref:glycosyltransferase family 2 protein n=1 Tax=Photobacterium kishitanii TaxID=318456 RepID=UPI0005D30A2A|nr:glycosyltransferase family 2 protein [Photobacterium kishitanii]KJG09618.1 glycosyltransferase [Photobacterium kishitanii]PSV05347.1 glycosyltransferase family 2 protein [Photobacterium kishitanii]PSV74988.1 glycosyltransferase family 2 protein [Photobacterium kishitanii]